MIGALGPIIRGDHKKRSRIAQIDMGCDTLVIGHWHQLIEITRLIVNGSLKGYDEYANQGNFDFEPPRQALWITHFPNARARRAGQAARRSGLGDLEASGMISFNCEACGAACLDSPRGYTTGCEHWPAEVEDTPPELTLYDEWARLEEVLR